VGVGNKGGTGEWGGTLIRLTRNRKKKVTSGICQGKSSGKRGQRKKAKQKKKGKKEGGKNKKGLPSWANTHCDERTSR